MEEVGSYEQKKKRIWVSRLPPNPSTGFCWQAQLDDPKSWDVGKTPEEAVENLLAILREERNQFKVCQI